jgi:anthranilate 1,2-dioxygenase (deaminating, decarboxylating) large subunit
MSIEPIPHHQALSLIESALDCRPEQGIYRVAREIFTQPQLFALEMEHIFEKTWIYACHESQVAMPHDFFTVTIGRQPLIISRDASGKLHALANTCRHRGATLVRVARGNQSTFTCPFHAWCYRSDGRLLKVKEPAQYGECLDVADYGLHQARIASYKGFVFVNLDVASTQTLEDFLGQARIFFDLVVAQSPGGELEVVPGSSSYTYDANWKLQNENGVDGYHVTTVHYNYIAVITQRAQANARRGRAQESIDVARIGAGEGDGWFAFENGHSVLFTHLPNAEVRPGYATVHPRLEREYGADFAKWAMAKARNLNVYPSLLFMDQMSTQIRVIRPIAWNKTEIHSFCLGVKGESAADRASRIRQFTDFFNVSGMGTPDDLVEFRESQRGFEGRLGRWNDISRGQQSWAREPDVRARELGIAPRLIGTDGSQEGLFVNQHIAWCEYLRRGLQASESNGG